MESVTNAYLRTFVIKNSFPCIFICTCPHLPRVRPTLPLPPMSYGAENVREQQDRVDRMEQLYFHDGRHKPEHKMHGLFTGLLDAQEPLHDA